MQNAIFVLDLLISGLTVKEKIEEADLKVAGMLKKALAEKRDISDEEVKEARDSFKKSLAEWASH
jgi:hypothetical protein